MKRWRLDSSKNCSDKAHYWNGTDMEDGTPWAFMAESTGEPCVTEYPNDCDYVRWDDAERVVSERDTLRARVMELEADTEYADKAAKQSILDLSERLAKLRARLAALEAPPVVPEGWEVVCGPCTGCWSVYRYAAENRAKQAAATRALAWAIEHDQRPPHAGDKETP